MSHVMRKNSFLFQSRCATNRAVQPQRKDRGLQSSISEEERLYYLRGAIQNYVDFFYNFKTENQPHMKLGIHII